MLKTFRRILEHDFRALFREPVQTVLDHARTVDGDGLGLAEYHATLRRRGRVIHVDDDLLRADERVDSCVRSNPRAPARAPATKHRPGRGLFR